jgi:hypothetical protein
MGASTGAVRAHRTHFTEVPPWTFFDTRNALPLQLEQMIFMGDLPLLEGYSAHFGGAVVTTEGRFDAGLDALRLDAAAPSLSDTPRFFSGSN